MENWGYYCYFTRLNLETLTMHQVSQMTSCFDLPPSSPKSSAPRIKSPKVVLVKHVHAGNVIDVVSKCCGNFIALLPFYRGSVRRADVVLEWVQVVRDVSRKQSE